MKNRGFIRTIYVFVLHQRSQSLRVTRWDVYIGNLKDGNLFFVVKYTNALNSKNGFTEV